MATPLLGHEGYTLTRPVVTIFFQNMRILLCRIEKHLQFMLKTVSAGNGKRAPCRNPGWLSKHNLNSGFRFVESNAVFASTAAFFRRCTFQDLDQHSGGGRLRESLIAVGSTVTKQENQHVFCSAKQNNDNSRKRNAQFSRQNRFGTRYFDRSYACLGLDREFRLAK